MTKSRKNAVTFYILYSLGFEKNIKVLEAYKRTKGDTPNWPFLRFIETHKFAGKMISHTHTMAN